MAGCGGLYRLSCYSSLTLVNKEGEASRAFADRACADVVYIGGGYIGGAYIDGACGGACVGKACADKACVDKVGRLGRGLSFKAGRPIISLS